MRPEREYTAILTGAEAQSDPASVIAAVRNSLNWIEIDAVLHLDRG